MTKRGRHKRGRHLGIGRSGTRLQGLASLMLGLLVAVALVIVGVPLATDGEWRTVQTASMAPQISAGDVVLLTPSSGPVRIGDIVAFRDPIRLDRDVLHRVTGLSKEGALVTKGDANDLADPWQVDPSEVIGVQSLTMPMVGRLVEIVSSDIGIFFFLAAPAMFILVNESRVWYRYVRFGSETFETLPRGRHLGPHGKHPAEAR